LLAVHRSPSSTHSTSIRVVTAAEEQAWNTERLSQRVCEPCCCVWIHSSPAVVLGSGQKRLATVADAMIPLITRDSGGGAVAVGPWLVSASIALPVGHRLVTSSLIDSYRWLGELHAQVLQGFGVRARAAAPAEVRARRVNGEADVRWACFGSLSPWEVTGLGGRKLVGLAQVRRRTGVLLVAGTLMWTPSWRMLATVMGRSPAEGDRLADLTTDCESELGGRLAPGEFSAALHDELRVRTT
jgi:lipoate-protein ligase A